MDQRSSIDNGLLSLVDVRKSFSFSDGMPFARSGETVRAVDGVSLALGSAQTLSIVGESGSGKTTLGNVVLGLEKPTSGKVYFRGEDITSDRRWGGASPIQAVFQDPWGSLNPRMRVEKIIAEPLVADRALSRSDIRTRVVDLLEFVGLESEVLRSYAHEFSGGQRQRIAIARALVARPQLIVLDEPVSALDVSIRAQIINLLRDLQAEFGSSYIMIAHDLASVRFMSHNVVVLYLGKVVESGPVESIFAEPAHPYTQALLSASLPTRPGRAKDRIVLRGEVPSATSSPLGCPFESRCPSAFERCKQEAPELRLISSGQMVSCHLYE